MEKTIRPLFKKVTGLDLGRKIYDCDCALFDLKRYPSRVVKISAYSGSRFFFKKKELDKIFSYCKKEQNPAIVKIFDYGSFDYQGKPHYYYIMEKLKDLPFSEDLKEELIAIIESFYGCKKAPIFLSNKLRNFLEKISNIKYSYWDIHGENIMIDKKGNYKLIDLESFVKDV